MVIIDTPGKMILGIDMEYWKFWIEVVGTVLTIFLTYLVVKMEMKSQKREDWYKEKELAEISTEVEVSTMDLHAEMSKCSMMFHENISIIKEGYLSNDDTRCVEIYDELVEQNILLDNIKKNSLKIINKLKLYDKELSKRYCSTVHKRIERFVIHYSDINLEILETDVSVNCDDKIRIICKEWLEAIRNFYEYRNTMD